MRNSSNRICSGVACCFSQNKTSTQNKCENFRETRFPPANKSDYIS